MIITDTKKWYHANNVPIVLIPLSSGQWLSRSLKDIAVLSSIIVLIPLSSGQWLSRKV